MPVCSVIIPCYNQSRFLAECLQSLVEQTLTDWEAVVVDDASSEGDVKAVVEAVHDQRVRFLRHEENKGLASARNSGIGAAETDLILPLDSDDTLAGECLQEFVNFLRVHPECDCVFADLALFGATSGEVRLKLKSNAELCDFQWLPGAGSMYRKALWQRVGGYCESASLRAGNEDWDFYLGAAEAEFKPAHLNKTLYRYRQSANSMAVRLFANDYVTRKFIYRRHKFLFDRYHKRTMFLGKGYLNSAEANFYLSQFRLTFTCGVSAFLLGYQRKKALHWIIRGSVPISVRMKVKSMFRRIIGN
jgi:glycosyltransferase involved in cell wall biosynthesis